VDWLWTSVTPMTCSNSQVLFVGAPHRTVDGMHRLLRSSRRRPTLLASAERARGPLPPAVETRVRLSADLLASLLEVEQRRSATLDDLEWADAVADRIVRRQAARAAARRGVEAGRPA
jgi:hypothetical protein